MKTLVKTIQGERGELYITTNGNRYKLADCAPLIEVWEHTDRVTILGKTSYGVKRIYLSLVLCEDMELTRPVDVAFLRKVDVFALVTDVQRTDGAFERLNLDNLSPDIIELDGRWTFMLPEKRELMNKLLAL